MHLVFCCFCLVVRAPKTPKDRHTHTAAAAQCAQWRGFFLQVPCSLLSQPHRWEFPGGVREAHEGTWMSVKACLSQLGVQRSS